MSENETLRWRLHGVRVIPGDKLDTNTAQTPGMNRAAAITHARVGAEKLQQLVNESTLVGFVWPLRRLPGHDLQGPAHALVLGKLVLPPLQ